MAIVFLVELFLQESCKKKYVKFKNKIKFKKKEKKNKVQLKPRT